jgi:hypothetical protein
MVEDVLDIEESLGIDYVIQLKHLNYVERYKI